MRLARIGARDAPENLRRACTTADIARRLVPEGDVDDRDHRVEVRPAERQEEDDEHAEAEDGGEGVDEQRQSGVVRELLGSGAGTDDDGREQSAAQELGADASQPMAERFVHAVIRSFETASSAPGTRR